jgi:signal-transduction protein with cAMP-binding, CBS, and nucleotidyltransferase domain
VQLHRVLVADLVLDPAVVVPADTPIVDVAQMLGESTAATVIVDGDPPFELTDHDIVRAFGARVHPDTPAGEIAHEQPVFVGVDAAITDVVTMMLATGRRELVVVDGKSVCGAIELTSATTALWGPTSLVGALRAALHVDEGWQ